VVGPAAGRPGRRSAPRVMPAGSEGAETQPPGDRHRNRTIGGRAVAQLAVGIVTPAVGRRGAGTRTGVTVILPCRRESSEARAPGDGPRSPPGLWCAVPKLAARARAPAVRCPGARKPAGVKGPGSEGAEAQAPGDRDGRCASRGRAVAELGVGVGAPAVGRPAARKPAGVKGPGGEGAEAQSPGDGQRSRAIHGRAGAELAEAVAAPTVGVPGTCEPTSV